MKLPITISENKESVHIEIEGKYNRAKIFTCNVEKEALSQIYNVLNVEFFKDSKIRIMPDVHAGKGCTIGTTMTIDDCVVPNLVDVERLSSRFSHRELFVNQLTYQVNSEE